MTSQPSNVPVTGGAAPIAIFIADRVATIPADASVLDAAIRLVDDDVGLLVVGTVEEVVGVISERDVVRALVNGDPAATLVADVATTNLVRCDLTATVAEVSELMMEQYVRHVLVEESGHLVGIVSARDLLGAYASDVG
jgi:CBS domain-containing protein